MAGVIILFRLPVCRWGIHIQEVFMKAAFPVVLPLLVALNLISFFLMGYDKHCARAGKWRVPERVLFLSALCFGAPGGTLGMFLFHHKTRHLSFRILFPLFLILQGLLLWAVFLR